MDALEITRLVVEVILAIVAAGGFKSMTDTKKYRQEVEKLRAEVETARTNTRSNELENVKKAMAILMEEVIHYAQEHHLMVSLETHNPDNVPMYEHFGFKLFGIV